MENLFKIAGEEFYFDLDAVSQFIKLEKEEDIDDLFQTEEELSEVSEDGEKELTDEEVMFDGGMGQMIDITKWELTKAMVETVLMEHGEIDENMGIAKLETQLSIPFRFSFNTLLINKIIVKNG